MLTPFLAARTAEQQRYNGALSTTRVRIEQTFGILKRRFGYLHQEVRLTPNRACTLIAASVVLHNIALTQQDFLAPEDYNNDMPPVIVPDNNIGLRFRDHVVRTYFT